MVVQRDARRGVHGADGTQSDGSPQIVDETEIWLLGRQEDGLRTVDDPLPQRGGADEGRPRTARKTRQYPADRRPEEPRQVSRRRGQVGGAPRELEVGDHPTARIPPRTKRKYRKLMAVRDRLRELRVQIRLERIRIVLCEGEDSQWFAPASPRYGNSAWGAHVLQFARGLIPTASRPAIPS